MRATGIDLYRIGFLGIVLTLAACDSNKRASGEISNEQRAAQQSASLLPAPDRVVPRSNWVRETLTSAMDGDILTGTTVTKVLGGASTVKVVLSCGIRGRSLKVQLSSYGADGTIPSAFVLLDRASADYKLTELGNVLAGPLSEQHEILPTGRIKFGDAEPKVLGTVFYGEKYENVIYWNVNKSANQAFEQMIRDRQNLRRDPSNQTISADPPTPTKEDLEEERLPHGAGNYLSGILPVVIEASNEQGTFEVSIPTGDPVVNEVLQSCSIATAQEESPSPLPVSVRASSAESKMVSRSTAPGNLPSNDSHPSFDCQKAVITVERLICSDNGLAKSDSDLAAAYRTSLGTPGADTSGIKRAQRTFISARNACTTTECIAAAYRARLAEIAQASSTN